MLQAGVIEPARSKCASNVCVASKRDGNLRFAIDFRHVNRITKVDSYYLPRIDNCLDSLNGSCLFTMVDSRSAFWQVAQDEADQDKNHFHYTERYLEILCTSTLFTRTPGLFQLVMDLIIAGLRWQSCLVYLDDVIIFSHTPPTIGNTGTDVSKTCR